MSSNSVIIENPPITNGELLTLDTNLTDLYSTSPNLSHLSSSTSSSSLCSSNKNMNTNSSSSINKITSNHQRKDSTLKLPYPVLSDHRDPSSILISLQKETQRTSKKISDIIKQIDECEQRLTLNFLTDNEKKILKCNRVKFKQQLDGLKKHERRVSLQIDFMTTKSEIKGLEDEFNSDQNQQIKILLGKLKQKLDKMKIYMRTRNEQMKKILHGKQPCLSNSNDHRKLSSSQQQQQRSGKDRKRSSISTNNSHINKRLKSTTPIVRLTSRVTSHESKKYSIQQPMVRFINKTTNSKINSASPTTPASSSSTLSPPLNKINQQNKLLSTVAAAADDDDDDDDELGLELNMDELFDDESYSEMNE